MELALLAARVLLAAVFLTAALAKLDDRAGWRRGLDGFGVPGGLARPLAVALPLAELATAGALVPTWSVRGGTAAALVLLIVFSAAMALNLARGRAPDCRCFGQVQSAPVSWRAVTRNLGLAALAASVAVAGGGAALGPARGATIAAGILLGSLLLVRRARRGRSADLRRAEGLPVGAEAPDFRLSALDGATLTLRELHEPGMSVLLVFTDPRCGPCSALAPRLADWQRNPVRDLSVWVVARGDPGESRTKAEEHGLANVLLDPRDHMATAYGALGTPSAVLVHADGTISSRLAVGAPAIERLVSGSGGAEPVTPEVEPRVELTRLELLTRAGSVAAALALIGVQDALGGLVLKCKYVRCGSRCCPKKAVCRRRRGRKVCICPDGREACGSKCCRETFVCRKSRRGKRVCVCPPRTRLCRGRCVSLTDPAHCGGCGRECPEATVCVDGECVGGDGTGTGPGGEPPCDCPPGRTCCDGACTDLNRDEAHCGRCDMRCPDGQECCDGTCKDVQLDPRNCGECGKRCRSGQLCANGRCADECPSGLTNCDGRCVDTQAEDDEHCGACGRTCEHLTTASHPACCGGTCVDLVRPDHCGACGRVCPDHCACFLDRQGRPVCTGFPPGSCPDDPP